MKPQPPEEELEKFRSEVSKLKAENTRLKQRSSVAAGGNKPKSKQRHIIRKVGVVLLVSAAIALLTVANLLFWFGNTVVKQDRFVAATAPLIKDPAVQNSMALYTTNSIFNNVDVEKATEAVLPPRADFLAPQLVSQLQSFTKSSFQKALANPSLQDKWNTTMATQHDRLITFASKYQGDGSISLNDIYNQLSASLSSTKLAFLAGKKLPPKIGSITLINAAWLPAFHNIVVNIDTWRLLTVITLVVTVTAAVWLSRNRRRTVYTFSIISAVMMLITLIALHIVKARIVGKIDPQYAEGVKSGLQIVFSSLTAQTITLMAAVLFVGAVAWVSSPSTQASAVKEQIYLLFSGKLHRRIFAEENGFTAWVKKNKRLLEWLVVAIIGGIMLLVRLSLVGLFGYILAMLILILVIEVIGGQIAQSDEPAHQLPSA
jgi:hypothetical protein